MPPGTKMGRSATSTPQETNPVTILPTVDGLAADLRQLQDNRQQQKTVLQPTLEFRLASIEIKDSADWLRWMYPSGLPQQLEGWIERLEAGDDYLTSVVLQTRTELGL